MRMNLVGFVLSLVCSGTCISDRRPDEGQVRRQKERNRGSKKIALFKDLNVDLVIEDNILPLFL